MTAIHEHRNVAYGSSQLDISLGPNNERLVPLAQDVAILRGVQVADALFAIAAIRALQTDPRAGDASVGFTKAHVQDVKAQFGQQAAHLLPCTITINGRPVWQLAASDARLEARTEACFAKTNVLPACFNRADSQAERMGEEGKIRCLTELFRATVQQLWRSAAVDRPRSPVDHRAVENALHIWFHDVSAAYRAAAAQKFDAWMTAEAKGKKPSADQRALESQVLEVYANSFQVASVPRFLRARASWLYDA